MRYAPILVQAAFLAAWVAPVAAAAHNALPAPAVIPAAAVAVATPEPRQSSAADNAMEQALSKIPVDAMVSQMLGSIDIGALAVQAEKSLLAAASGKAPEAASPERERAAQEAQAKMAAALQKQFAAVAPDLIRSLFAVVTPMLAQMRAELAGELKPASKP